MTHKNRFFFFILLSVALLLSPLSLCAQSHQGPKGKSAKDVGTEQMNAYPSLPEPGKKVPFGGGYYFIYSFDKKPKLGTMIMKVEIFAAEGKKDTSFEVRADAGMPSMRGAHETGDRPFTLSKKGDFLLPINIVMPGDWEIKLTVIKDGKVVSRGRYNFGV